LKRNQWLSLITDAAKNLASLLGPLREFVERGSDRRAHEVGAGDRPFILWNELQQRTGGTLSIAGRDVLEIGPGRSLGLGLMFLAAGARRVYAYDRFNHLFWDELDVAHLKAVLDRLERENWPDAGRARAAVRSAAPGRVQLNEDLLIYRRADSASLPLEASAVDVSYSNAVLEHVHRPFAVVRELARVTRKDGDSIHEIDFRDHFVYGNRLRLLQFDEWEWQVRTRMRPGYTNRLRLGDFRQLFAEAGFTFQIGHPTNQVTAEHVNTLRSTFSRRFERWSNEDLAILSFWGWWKKDL
jgi:SAM-dependent methyltransferase